MNSNVQGLIIKVKTFFDEPVNRLFIITLAAVTLLKMWVITLFPITCDEAYYWLWHKHLDLSYVDHPPLIAYFNKLISLFGPENLFHFRFAAILLALAGTALVWLIANELFGPKVAAASATLFAIVPHYVIIWQTLTMDNLLIVWWLLALYLWIKIMNRSEPYLFILISLVGGLGLLTKYSYLLFFFCAFLSLLFIKEKRKLFAAPYLYVSLLMTALLFFPVILWNMINEWPSLSFYATRTTAQFDFQNISNFFGDQLIHFSPFLFIPFLLWGKKIWDSSKLLFLFSYPVFLIFLAYSFLSKVWPHWMILYQPAALIAIAYILLQRSIKSFYRIVISLIIFDLLLVTQIVFIDPGLFKQSARYQNNGLLEKKYAALEKNTYILVPYLGIASQLTFYTKQTTYMTQGILQVPDTHRYGQKQFDRWGFPSIKKKDHIVYFGENRPETRALLLKYFQSVEIDPALDIELLEGYLNQLVPYHCKNFLGLQVKL